MTTDSLKKEIEALQDFTRNMGWNIALMIRPLEADESAYEWHRCQSCCSHSSELCEQEGRYPPHWTRKRVITEWPKRAYVLREDILASKRGVPKEIWRCS